MTNCPRCGKEVWGYIVYDVDPWEHIHLRPWRSVRDWEAGED